MTMSIHINPEQLRRLARVFADAVVSDLVDEASAPARKRASKTLAKQSVAVRRSKRSASKKRK